jgi:hypothetical protein
MNREEMMMMAKEAGICMENSILLPAPNGENEALERFAALVAAHEREACAKVCEPQSAHDDPLTAWKIAADIRARGEVPR